MGIIWLSTYDSKNICMQADLTHCSRYYEARKTMLYIIMILLGT